MSRKKRKGLYWGEILKEFRQSAGVSMAEMAEVLGYKATGKGQPKGMISEIEHGKLPINEAKIRLWVAHSKKNMFDFYQEAARQELGRFVIDPLPKDSLE